MPKSSIAYKAYIPSRKNEPGQVASNLGDINASSHLIADTGSPEQSDGTSSERPDATVIEMNILDTSMPLITDATSSTNEIDTSIEDTPPDWGTYTLTALYMGLIVLGAKYVPRMNPDKSIFNMGPFGPTLSRNNDTQSSPASTQDVSDLPLSITENSSRYESTWSMLAETSTIDPADSLADFSGSNDSDTPMWESAAEQSLGSYGLPPLSHDIIAKEIALIERLDASSVALPQSLIRDRRAINIRSNLEKLQDRFKTLGVGPDYPSNFHEIRDEFYKLAEKKRTEWNNQRVTGDKKIRPFSDVQFLTILMFEMNTVLQEHASSGEIDEAYHYIYKMYQSTWDIVAWLKKRGISTTSIENDFRRYQHPESPYLLNTKSGITTTDIDMYLFDQYYASWISDRLTSKDDIIIHTQHASRIFTMKEIIEDKHASFIKNGVTAAHRRYDQTGKFDARTTTLASSTHAKKFNDYTQTSGFKRFITEKVDLLYEQMLTNITGSLLYLDRKKILKELREEMVESSPLLTRHGNDVLLKMIDTRIEEKVRWKEQVLAPLMALIEAVTLDSSLFGELDQEKLLLSDLRYSFTNPALSKNSDEEIRIIENRNLSERKTDTAMLVEYLCHKAGISGMSIAERDNIQVDFPEEFSPELQWALIALTKTIQKKWAEIDHSLKLSSAKTDLISMMPSLAKALQHRLDRLCQKHDFQNCKLTEKVKLKFSKIGEEAITKEFTYSEVLLGDVKKFLALHPARTTSIPTYPRALSKEKHRKNYDDFIHEMRLYHFDNDIDRLYIDAADNSALQERFLEYEKLATAIVPSTHALWFYFEQTPLLRIYFSENNILNLDNFEINISRNAGKYITTGNLYLFSFLSGSIIEFRSFTDFLNAVKQNSDLRTFINSHSRQFKPIDKNIPYHIRKAMPHRTIFQNVLDFQSSNIHDYLTGFIEEQYLHFFQRIIENKSYIAMPLEIAYGPLGGLAAELSMAFLARLGQALILKSPQERDTLAREAIVDYVETILSCAAGNIASNLTQRGIKIMAAIPNEQFSKKVNHQLMKQINDHLVKGLRLPISTNVFEESLVKGGEKLSSSMVIDASAGLIKKLMDMLPALQQNQTQNVLSKDPRLNYLDLRGTAGLDSVLPKQPTVQTAPKTQNTATNPSYSWGPNLLMW